RKGEVSRPIFARLFRPTRGVSGNNFRLVAFQFAESGGRDKADASPRGLGQEHPCDPLHIAEACPAAVFVARALANLERHASGIDQPAEGFHFRRAESGPDHSPGAGPTERRAVFRRTAFDSNDNHNWLSLLEAERFGCARGRAGSWAA